MPDDVVSRATPYDSPMRMTSPFAIVLSCAPNRPAVQDQLP